MKSGLVFQSFWSSRLTTTPCACSSAAAGARMWWGRGRGRRTGGPGLLRRGVFRGGKQRGRGGVAAQVFFQRGKAKAGGAVMLEDRGAVDQRVEPAEMPEHPGHQRAHRCLVLKICTK